MAAEIPPLEQIPASRFETTAILKALAPAARQLAEFKGVAASIPNQQILLSALGIQEAKDSSAVENIVTTHDELFREASLLGGIGSPAAKEVLRYREALTLGFELVRKHGLIRSNDILEIQQVLELNNAGFRRQAGTVLRDGTGRTIYTPPQDPQMILTYMGDLERFVNGAVDYPADPLIRMALVHHQFETIHPFYDGNGRTGRILNVLYLVKEGLLDLPILYLSRYILRTKAEYYHLLQAVRDHDEWEAWVTYMLVGVEETARRGIATVRTIHDALLEVKHEVRSRHPRMYSQDLINHLFSHPYTRVRHLEEALGVSRLTATKYLDTLAESGVLTKLRAGRANFYVNVRLLDILTSSE